MRNNTRHTGFKKLLIQRLAFTIAVLYLLGPFQQQLSNVLHRLSHDLGAPDYVMTHTGTLSNVSPDAHQYGEHRTGAMLHDHQLIDFFQSLLKDTDKDRQQSDPIIPPKSFDKHLATFRYSLAQRSFLEIKDPVMTPEQSICKGHTDLWLEPPIGTLI
jgi:hypothetical protein